MTRYTVDPDARFAQRLTQALDEIGMTNRELAKRVGVHETTVSRWKAGMRPDDDTIRRVASVLRDEGVAITEAVLVYGETRPIAEHETSHTALVSEVTFSSVPARQRARVYVEQLLLEFAEAGADEAELDWARRVLTNPTNYTYNVGGHVDDMTDEQKLQHMEGLAVGVRHILRARGRKVKLK